MALADRGGHNIERRSLIEPDSGAETEQGSRSAVLPMRESDAAETLQGSTSRLSDARQQTTVCCRGRSDGHLTNGAIRGTLIDGLTSQWTKIAEA